MSKEIYKTCVVVCNEVGECVEVYELKTLNETQIASYKAKARQNKAKSEIEKQKALELEQEQLKVEQEKEYRQALVIAKLQFNDLVEKGKSQTTQEFENEYDKFILGGELDLDKAPIDYKLVLERVR